MSCSHAAARRTVPERAVRERCSRARPSLGVTGDMNMTTVQVAIRDKEYSQSICNLLRREGRYSVLAVDEPDLTREGVIVLDCEHMEGLPLAEEAPDMFVLVTRKDPDKLARLWNAGIRHVVFQEDSPTTAQLAVSAAELRQPRNVSSRDPVRSGGERPRPALHRHYRRLVSLPVLEDCGGGCRGSCSHLCFPHPIIS